MKARLGVNIDHVATLRQARGESYPSTVEAAKRVLESGADQITIHLREDRRHIQDTDVEAIKLVTQKYGKPLNFEMGCNDEIIDIAIATTPEWICLVPEKREEKTTEGGLNLLDSSNFERIQRAIEKFRLNLKETKISLFLEAQEEILQKANLLHVDAVEIHTGDYARAYNNNEDITPFIDSFKASKIYLESHNIAHHAGHGLTLESLAPLCQEKLFEEYNIGHWIISEAIFGGLGKVVGNLDELLQKHPLN